MQKHAEQMEETVVLYTTAPFVLNMQVGLVANINNVNKITHRAKSNFAVDSILQIQLLGPT